jgi:hypothetical protein
MDKCQDFRGVDVDFYQFLNRSLTEVLSLSLCKLELKVLPNSYDKNLTLREKKKKKKVFNPIILGKI